MATCSKRRVTEEDLVKDDLKKSRVEDSKAANTDGQVVAGAEPQASKSEEEVKTEAEDEGKEEGKEFMIGETLYTLHECMRTIEVCSLFLLLWSCSCITLNFGPKLF